MQILLSLKGLEVKRTSLKVIWGTVDGEAYRIIKCLRVLEARVLPQCSFLTTPILTGLLHDIHNPRYRNTVQGSNKMAEL